MSNKNIRLDISYGKGLGGVERIYWPKNAYIYLVIVICLDPFDVNILIVI